MGFELTGYLLEPPRVGASNSPFTATPNNYVSDQVAYDAAYPSSSESAPRADYVAWVEQDGNLPNATFAWTKNEGVVVGSSQTQTAFQRFDYEGATQRFKPLPGGPPSALETPLGPSSNATRLRVPAPTITNQTDFPFRIAVGSSDSGTTFSVTLVADDSLFTPPASGTVQLSRSTGNLNWNTTDITTTYAGQTVRFQRQPFFTFLDSTGILGTADEVLLLNPIPGPAVDPGTYQIPLIRFSSGLYLLADAVPNEGSFVLDPGTGVVQWAVDTGRLNFSPSDVLAHAGQSVYYDGVAFARGLTPPDEAIGAMPVGYTSLAFTTLPPEGGDIVFSVGGTQMAVVLLVTAFTDSVGQSGVAQVMSDGFGGGLVRFSQADRASYAGQSVIVTLGDVIIDNGVSLRFYRNPVNLNGQNADLKDVAAFYAVEGAILASPIVASPQVFLPAIPIDSISYPITVNVEQGTGTFTGTLPRLDTASPPAGIGYVLDVDQRRLQYAQRKVQTLTELVQPSGGIGLPDQIILPSNLVLELETGAGTGVYDTLTLGEDALFEPNSGVVSFVETKGYLIAEGTNGTTSNGVFTDADVDFDTVLPGDIVLLLSSGAEGLYTVQAVTGLHSLTLDVVGPDASPIAYEIRRGREILADRFFQEVLLADPATKVERVRSLGAVTNSPRANIAISTLGRVRFRFDGGTFSTSVVEVATNSAFHNPGSLPAGVVEVSVASGDVNFSSSDVTNFTTVYSVVQLQQGRDYTLTPQLGLISYTDRAMAYDEGYLTYVPLTEDGPQPVVTEPVTWLVRKEVTLAHPAPTSILHFDPTERPVASQPAPAVFRGGRPQVLGVQCLVNAAARSIQFLPDSQITNALPHGDVVNPDERVYIDYYVTQAFGGEQTTNVLQPPMSVAQVSITGGANSFTISGDWTTTFKAGYLLRIEQEEVYLLGTVSYASTTNLTTVALATPQLFTDDFNSPRLYLSSGPTPYTTALYTPSYFIPETAAYQPVPRGMNKLVLPGDLTAEYKSGTVLSATDSAASFLDFYAVTGAAYKADTSTTEVILAANTTRQYVYGQQTLKHSVRPVLEASTTTVQTSLSPVLTEPYTVYRRTTGSPGELLGTQPATSYTLDDSGNLKYLGALQANEEFGILYTGYTVVGAGPRVRATYTNIIVPSAANGLLSQILKMDYTLYAPDTFYYRVETFTNFRGELAQQYEDAAKAGSPSGGPTTSNGAQPNLYQQGRPSLYFNEGHLANEDIVARASLLFYNDAINYLEDALQDMDGRVVGDNSGRFLFDGTTGSQVIPPAVALNQIDDSVQISPAPYAVTFTYPSFTVVSIGTYQMMYLPAWTSRFFPTGRNVFNVSTQGVVTGDSIYDTGNKNLVGVDSLRSRLAWAVVTAEVSSGAVLNVDQAEGAADLVRPPFLSGQLVTVVDQQGNVLIPDAGWAVLSTTGTSVTLDNPVPTTIPVGATIYQAPTDPTLLAYTNGLDYTANPDTGQLLYISAPLTTNPVAGFTPLNARVAFVNSLTAPYKFPALYGGTTNDDGDVSLPIQTPNMDSEATGGGIAAGLLLDELAIVGAGGTLRVATTPPYTSGTGQLTAPNIIHDAAGFGAVPPKVYDLVRILTGANGPSTFRRITNVNLIGNDLTVDTPFALPQVGTFQYTVTVSTSIVPTGTVCTSITSLNSLNDAVTDFLLLGVEVGDTIVIEGAGANQGIRRQVTVVAQHSLQVFPNFLANSGAGITYRVDNALDTFNGQPVTDMIAVENAELLILVLNAGSTVPHLPINELSSLEGFLDQCFTDVTGGISGSVSAASSMFTDVGADFSNDGVSSADFLYIRSALNPAIENVYAIDGSLPITTTSLYIVGTFPATESLLTYRIVKSFGASLATCQTISGILRDLDALIANTIEFLSKASVQIPQPTDAGAYAVGLLTADMDDRETALNARVSALNTTTLSQITDILEASDRFYDKRWTWIDSRINLQTGILTKKTRAVQDRIATQADVLNQLIKLLSVQT